MPERTQRSRAAGASYFRRSTSHRTSPPAMMGADRWTGRYSPMATGSTGVPSTSMVRARNTPMNTSAQGRSPPMTPSTTSFISVAWAAGSSLEP